MKHYEFDCGCKFEIKSENPLRLKFTPLIEEIPLTCSRTWKLLQDGKTKGCFQLESFLGQHLSKKLKPEHIEHLSALVAIMRPGCLEAMIDGKSITNHYIDRKNGEENIEYYHSALEPILKKTYGVMCLHEDTYISMANGTEQKIKYIKSGNLIQSVNEKTHQILKNDQCLRMIKTKIKHGLNIRLENGYTITVTKDHKIFTNEGWIEAHNLNYEKHTVAIAFNQHSNTNYHKQLDSEFFAKTIHTAYFIGQMVGDGSAGAIICSGLLKNHQKLLPWLKLNSTLILNPYFHQRSWYIGISHRKLCNWKLHRVGNRKTQYRLWIDSLGLHKTKNAKIIPKCIFTTSHSNRRAFLAGLLDADGHISEKHNDCNFTIHYCSNNYEIINGVRKLLAIDGIATYIDPTKLHIHVRNVNKFIKLIGPYLVIKKQQYDNRLLDDKLYGMVTINTIKNEILKSHTSIRSYFKNPQSFNRSSLYRNSNFCGQWMGKKLGIYYGDLKWMRIKSIQTTPHKEQFYSISIKHNHNVIGNGIVVKNCYQEQTMRIATDIANFNPQDSNTLRKAIGKKKPELMAKMKKEFIEGCKQTNKVTEEQAEEIFGWIEKSQRYLFNLSHSASYALNSYLSAYAKAHFPKEFFTIYLKHSKNKPKPREEICELVQEARRMNVDVRVPNLQHLNKKFKLIDGQIYFGLEDIKDMGIVATKKLVKIMKGYDVLPNRLSWFIYLIHILPKINSKSARALMKSGALSFFERDRIQMCYEYDLYRDLSKNETKWIEINLTNALGLTEILEKLLLAPVGKNGGCPNKTRVKRVQSILHLLKNPPHSLKDTPISLSQDESALLGIPLTCLELESYDISMSNCTCQQWLNQQNNHHTLILATQIDNVNEITTKNKRQMAFLTISDITGSLNSVVVFPNQWSQYKRLLYNKNNILLSGKRGQDKDSLICEKIWQLT